LTVSFLVATIVLIEFILSSAYALKTGFMVSPYLSKPLLMLSFQKNRQSSTNAAIRTLLTGKITFLLYSSGFRSLFSRLISISFNPFFTILAVIILAFSTYPDKRAYSHTTFILRGIPSENLKIFLIASDVNLTAFSLPATFKR